MSQDRSLISGFDDWPTHERARLVEMVEGAMEECFAATEADIADAGARYSTERRAACVRESTAAAARALLNDLRLAGFLRERS